MYSLLDLSAQKFYCRDSLQLLGHHMTAIVLRDNIIKGTFCMLLTYQRKM
jgi:hypothetical protein